MNFTEQEAQQLREHVKNLPDEERKQFIGKFQSLSDEGQTTVLDRLGFREKPIQAQEPITQPKNRIAPYLAAMADPLQLRKVAPPALKYEDIATKYLQQKVQPYTQTSSAPVNFGALMIQDILSMAKPSNVALTSMYSPMVGMIAKSIPKLINLGGRKTAQRLAEKADTGLEKLAQSLSNKYDEVFGNINAKIKTDSIAKDIQSAIDEFPEGANVGKLKSILNRVQGTEEKPITEISAKELFNIKKEIGKTIPRSIWNGISDADAISNSKEQLYWKLTKRLEEVGGKAYKGLTEEYKNFKQTERLARKMFYRQGIPSNVPLSGTYDVPTQRAVRGLSEQLPQKEQFAQQFEAWRRGRTVKDITKKGALTYGAYELLRRMGRGQ